MSCRRAILAAAAAAAALAAGQARAQLRGDTASLGRGAQSGAVCQAVRDYDDPVAQHPGGRAWAIRCRGWDAPIGRLYLAPTSAALATWRTGLAARAECKAAQPAALGGLVGVTRAACRLAASTSPYLVYQGRRGRYAVAGESYAAAGDVLETGLRVAAGAMAPPPSAALQESAAGAEIAAQFGGSSGALSSVLGAASIDVQRLRARGYVQNNEWRFEQAETDFRALLAAARAANAPPRERAEALLNLALNISNSGRFAEAELLFAQADALVASTGDQVLLAEALDYRALHLRNQRHFDDAIEAAGKALRARASVRSETGHGAAVRLDAKSLEITPDLSTELNFRSSGMDLMGGDAISPSQRLLIQDAEAEEVIGSSRAAKGDLAGAGAALDQSAATLRVAEQGGTLSVRLRARVLADQADLQMDRGRFTAAADGYAGALKVLRIRHAGTSTEAGLLMDLGRAQARAGQADLALANYDRAFQLFREVRGSLGASADAAEPYFDLLLARSASDPAHAHDYAQRFFTASESVVSEATAATISRLAARVASGDDATAGLVRAVDDTRRQLSIAESRVAALQAANAYAGAAKAAADQDLAQVKLQLDALNAQLLTANPRYDQLVASEATLDDLQKALRPDEAYIKTVLLGDRGYGLLVTRTEAKPYPVALSRAAGARAAEALRAPFEAEDTLPPFDVAASSALFQALFGPVAPQLFAARHLVYEPAANLVSVPAALLVTDPGDAARIRARPMAPDAPDYRGVAWLGARLDSSLALSAASFLQARAFKPSHARQAYLGFGDPQLSASNPNAFRSVLKRGGLGLDAVQVCGSTRRSLLGLPSLPDTAGEVRTVGESLGAPAQNAVLGAQFTDTAVRERKDLADFRILYFATHALLPMPDACLPEPALVTSAPTADNDGLLDASDILDLKLDADLVVLSACDTGAAGTANTAQTGLQSGGEALGGLSRAVIYAGGRNLLVSHWSVDSAATKRLMTDLFRVRAPTAAEGLQAAQRAMQGEVRWSHPYFWAPFTVVGDGARPIPSAGQNAAAPPAAAAGRGG